MATARAVASVTTHHKNSVFAWPSSVLRSPRMPFVANFRVADDTEAIGLAPVYFGCTSLEAIAENFCYSAIADSSVDGV